MRNTPAPLVVPLIDNRLAPGPWIVRFLSMSSWPDARVTVCGEEKTLVSKLIVPPDAASAIAWRRLPAPLSFVFVTVIVSELSFKADRISERPPVARYQGLHIPVANPLAKGSWPLASVRLAK